MLQRLSPEANIPAPLMNRVLCILKPTRYRPDWEKRIVGKEVSEIQFRQLPKLQQLLVWPSYRQYYVGAPRSSEYMLDLVLEFLHENAPNAEVDLLVEADQVANFPEIRHEQFNHVYGTEGTDLKPWPENLWKEIEEKDYDAIIMLYADALGISWKHIERKIKRAGVRTVIALNGRRRAFLWDDAARRALARGRFLETWILPELFLTPFVYVLAIPLAIFDFVKSLFPPSQNKALP